MVEHVYMKFTNFIIFNIFYIEFLLHMSPELGLFGVHSWVVTPMHNLINQSTQNKGKKYNFDPLIILRLPI